METHYVCTGRCGTISDNPGVCMSEGCPKINQPLVSCSCSDDRHADVMSGSEDGEVSLDEPQIADL